MHAVHPEIRILARIDAVAVIAEMPAVTSMLNGTRSGKNTGLLA